MRQPACAHSRTLSPARACALPRTACAAALWPNHSFAHARAVARWHRQDRAADRHALKDGAPCGLERRQTRALARAHLRTRALAHARAQVRACTHARTCAVLCGGASSCRISRTSALLCPSFVDTMDSGHLSRTACTQGVVRRRAAPLWRGPISPDPCEGNRLHLPASRDQHHAVSGWVCPVTPCRAAIAVSLWTCCGGYARPADLYHRRTLPALRITHAPVLACVMRASTGAHSDACAWNTC